MIIGPYILADGFGTSSYIREHQGCDSRFIRPQHYIPETTPFPKEEEFIYEEAAEEADLGFFFSNKALRVLGFGWGLG